MHFCSTLTLSLKNHWLLFHSEMYPSLFIHMSTEGQCRCFRVLAKDSPQIFMYLFYMYAFYCTILFNIHFIIKIHLCILMHLSCSCSDLWNLFSCKNFHWRRKAKQELAYSWSKEHSCAVWASFWALSSHLDPTTDLVARHLCWVWFSIWHTLNF